MSISTITSGVLAVILAIALLPRTLADEFTSPSNSNSDLTTQYTLGQTVTVNWRCSLKRITLMVSHWDVGSDTVLGVLLVEALNPGLYTWTIGQNDNINLEEISKSPNFVLRIKDPAGKAGSANNFINNVLSSRGFRINPNVTSSSSTKSAATKSAATTSAATTSVSIAALSTTATSTPTSAPSTGGLGAGAKAGIGIGVVIGGLALIASGAYLAVTFIRRKRGDDYGSAASSSPPPPPPPPPPPLADTKYDGTAHLPPYALPTGHISPTPPYGGVTSELEVPIYGQRWNHYELGDGRNV
ncbi:MAG: hypothetical protein M1813_008572 [Trichoglossum hirsutum]|nr:MAG: hypothetical protein M1813_008572 [Trichoglossum hirsutum]